MLKPSILITSRLAILIVLLALILYSNAKPPLPAAHAASLSDMPLAEQASISGVLGRDDADYAVTSAPDGLRAANPAQHLITDFAPEGVYLSAGPDHWAIGLVGYGYGDAEQAVTFATPRARANRVKYTRDSLSEWYVNGPQGLEQGFTLERRPAGERQGLLTLTLALGGNLEARVDTGRVDLGLERADGVTVLRYSALTARDAAGRELPAWLEAAAGRLRVRVDDLDAIYPVTIDPIIQMARLTASYGTTNDGFGGSIAISADASTIVVGATGHTVGSNANQGEAYVFVKSGNWSANLQEIARLTASNGMAGDVFGSSVAINGNASTIAVGAGLHSVMTSTNQGEVYVFVKPGSWTGDLNENARLTSSDGTTNDYFGSTLAISADASTIAASASFHKVGSQANQGEAYVFVKPGSWSGDLQENARLTASDGAGDGFGRSIAISADANTIVSGAPDHNGGHGGAYVFVKSGSWTGDLQENARLTSSDAVMNDKFSYRIAISGDASTIVAGAPFHKVGSIMDQFQHGEAYVFAKPIGGWSANLQENARLTASNSGTHDNLSLSVAIDANGGTIVAGAPYHVIGNNGQLGESYVYVKPIGGWSGDLQENTGLTASDGATNDRFGTSNAISADASVIAVGAFKHNANTGEAYVFGPGFNLYLPFITR